MNNFYEKLDSQLDILVEQMHELNMTRHIYYEIKDIVEVNQKILTSNHFYSWIDHTYTTTMAVGIRRLVDRNRDSISFTSFLSKIKENPHILSRRKYKELYIKIGSNLSETCQDEQFDKLAGMGADYINPGIVEQELEKLKTVTLSLKKFTDKRIAHYDRKSPPLGPSYNEIDEAFDILCNLLHKYYHLFRAASLSLGPYIQYDWKEIFRVAWIPPSD